MKYADGTPSAGWLDLPAGQWITYAHITTLINETYKYQGIAHLFHHAMTAADRIILENGLAYCQVRGVRIINYDDLYKLITGPVEVPKLTLRIRY